MSERYIQPITRTIHAVHAHPSHGFSKSSCATIALLAGQGVVGDAHCGPTVQHRSRVKRDPAQPNLRQVHLMALERLQELQSQGFKVRPGSLGENITTTGIALESLPTATRLRMGSAEMEITGLRNPCAQLDQCQAGLMAAMLARDEVGNLIRKAGVMAIVTQGGQVAPGDMIEIVWPDQPHTPLVCV